MASERNQSNSNSDSFDYLLADHKQLLERFVKLESDHKTLEKDYKLERSTAINANARASEWESAARQRATDLITARTEGQEPQQLVDLQLKLSKSEDMQRTLKHSLASTNQAIDIVNTSLSIVNEALSATNAKNIEQDIIIRRQQTGPESLKAQLADKDSEMRTARDEIKAYRAKDAERDSNRQQKADLAAEIARQDADRVRRLNEAADEANARGASIMEQMEIARRILAAED